MVCAFTGHRPEKLPWGSRETDPRCCALKVQIAHAVRSVWEEGATVFACGLPGDATFYFAESVLRLQGQGKRRQPCSLPGTGGPVAGGGPDPIPGPFGPVQPDSYGGACLRPRLYAAPEPGDDTESRPPDQRLRRDRRRDRCDGGLCQAPGPAGVGNLAVIIRASPTPARRRWRRCR